jgi:hypothetical protein
MALESPPLKDIFVSYNRADEAWSHVLSERIERETRDGTPDGPRLTAFFAPWDIELGQNILNRINDGLRQARFFALVMSPEFFSSDWTNLEWTNQVALDPRNATGRILPILRREVSMDQKQRIVIPAPFNVLNRLDFRDGRDFEAAFRELIRILRGLPKERGSAGPPTVSLPKSAQTSATSHDYAFASATPEILVANLLELDGVPDVVWSGDTDTRDPAEVVAKAPTKEAFILEDKRLHSFAHWGDPLCSLHAALKAGSTVTSTRRADWLADDDRRRSFVRLLNRCVCQHAFERHLSRDEKGRFYFRPVYGGEETEPQTRNHQFPDEAKPRAVAARKVNPKDNSIFWVHYAAKLRVEILGERFFLRIEPAFVFTHDGREAIGGKNAGKLAIQWTGQQRNPDVLRTVLFWARYLADGRSQIRIAAGGGHLVSSALPAVVRTNFGISGDYIRMAALVEDPTDVLDEVATTAEAVEALAEDDADEPGNEDA